MRIAVATTAGFNRVTGHAGRARKWLVFDTDAIDRPARVDLAADMVFHHFDGDRPHPLDGVAAFVTHSAGEGFLGKMKRRGVVVALTSESDPAKAATGYLEGSLPLPKPRPIGELLCKTIDRLTHR